MVTKEFYFSLNCIVWSKYIMLVKGNRSSPEGFIVSTGTKQVSYSLGKPHIYKLIIKNKIFRTGSVIEFNKNLKKTIFIMITIIYF